MSRQPHEIVWALSNAEFAARCLHVVADLGVADLIEDEPVSVDVLAEACEVDADALERVLRLLTSHGVFDRRPDGYGHTPSSRLLRDDHPMSMRPFAQMMGLPLVRGSVTELGQSVRTGRPGLETLEPKGIWAYLQEHPGEAQVFGRAMTAKAGAEVAAVRAAYDFTRFGTIADIGGGRGHLLRAVLDAAPSAEGVLFDLPAVIQTLDVEHPRMAATAGDFFVDALPRADAYLLMEVLHDWSDQECVTILGAIRRAAPDHATLLVIESLIPEGVADPRAYTLDVIMLAVTGGRERTANQLSALFDRAGFRLDKVIDTTSPMRIVEARLA
jgi:C-methyltransferase